MNEALRKALEHTLEEQEIATEGALRTFARAWAEAAKNPVPFAEDNMRNMFRRWIVEEQSLSKLRALVERTSGQEPEVASLDSILEALRRSGTPR